MRRSQAAVAVWPRLSLKGKEPAVSHRCKMAQAYADTAKSVINGDRQAIGCMMFTVFHSLSLKQRF